MKLLYLTTAYPAYLRDFFARNPRTRHESYEQQKAALEYDHFAWIGVWSHVLPPFGYEVQEVVANNKPLQRAWAKEHGLKWHERTWLLETAREQIRRFSPDILFVDDYATFDHRWLSALRTDIPSIQLILGWCAAPFDDASVFDSYDVVLSCSSQMVEMFRSMGHTSVHLNHAFDDRVLQRIQLTATPSIPFSFVGSVVPGAAYHSERAALLGHVGTRTELTIFSDLRTASVGGVLKKVAKRGLYWTTRALVAAEFPQQVVTKLPVAGRSAAWNEPPLAKIPRSLRRRIRPPVYGLQMFQTLAGSAITLNNHIGISPRSASNLRLFEATGVGTCLLTDQKDNLHELFAVGTEVVTYDSPEDCVEKVQWLLDHCQERRKIAAAGQARTLSQHRFESRAEKFHEIVTAALP